jgi:hypothetical protein
LYTEDIEKKGLSPFLTSLLGAIVVQIEYQTVEKVDLVDIFTTIYGI